MCSSFDNSSTVTFSSSSWNYLRILRRSWKILLGLLLPVLLMPLAFSDAESTRCGYVLLVMATFWTTEALPIAATALMPVALFPLLGLMSTNDVSKSYMKATNMMFFGGLIMAIAVENSNLHKRIALKVLLLIGLSIKMILLGLMLTTMFLSMWISNTASTAMMIPIVEAMISEISSSRKQSVSIEPLQLISSEEAITIASTTHDNHNVIGRKNWADDAKMLEKVRQTLLLSIAYAANIGGTGTLTGTGTNLILQGLLEDIYPNSSEVTFASWFYYAAPGMILCIAVAWLFLYCVYLRKSAENTKDQEVQIRALISRKYKELGPLSFQEKAVAILFSIVVFLWLFRDPKFITGWAKLIHSDIKDATPVILIALVMFILPASFKQLRDDATPVKKLLDWPTVQRKMPWGTIVLLGGGLALAEGTKQSGLSVWLGQQLLFLNEYSPIKAMCLLTVFVAFLTEVTSNVATASVLLPALSMETNPLLLMIPTTIAVSFAFMLPVATPPNALVFETIGMKTIDMIKPGFVMNFLCVAIQLIMINTWGVLLFNLNDIPSWVPVRSNGTIS